MTVSVRVEQAADDPIVKFTFEGLPDEASVREVNARAEQFLAQMGRYYAIVDVRGIEATLGEIIALFGSPDSPNIFQDGRVTPVFVGEPVPHDPTDTAQTPIFDTPDEAESYIRRQIASR